MSYSTPSIANVLGPRFEGRAELIRRWVREHTDPEEVRRFYDRLSRYRTTITSSTDPSRIGLQSEYEILLTESPAVNEPEIYQLWSQSPTDRLYLAQNPHLNQTHQDDIAEQAVSYLEQFDPDADQQQKRSRGHEAVLALQHLWNIHGYTFLEDHIQRLWKLLPDGRQAFEAMDRYVLVGRGSPETAALAALILAPNLGEKRLWQLYQLLPREYPGLEQLLYHPSSHPRLWQAALDDPRDWPETDLVRGLSITPRAWELPAVRELLTQQLAWEGFWKLAARSDPKWRRFWARKALQKDPAQSVEHLKKGKSLRPQDLEARDFIGALAAATRKEVCLQLQRWAGQKPQHPGPSASTER